MNALDLTTPGFNLANARALADISARAYATFTIDCQETDTQVLIVPLDNCIVVAFRGTSDIRDWITDVSAWRRDILGKSVHAGFYNAVASVMDQITAKLAELAPDPHLPIVVTGHSLGAADAMLFAWRWLTPDRIAAVYTFGQPRVGDHIFAADYNSGRLAAKTFRVTHAADIVPWVPWLCGTYVHAADEWFIASSNLMGIRAKVFPVRNPTVAAKLWSQKWEFLTEGARLKSGHYTPFGSPLLRDHPIARYQEALA